MYLVADRNLGQHSGLGLVFFQGLDLGMHFYLGLGFHLGQSLGFDFNYENNKKKYEWLFMVLVKVNVLF
jgi:hypothetical protein